MECYCQQIEHDAHQIDAFARFAVVNLKHLRHFNQHRTGNNSDAKTFAQQRLEAWHCKR